MYFKEFSNIILIAFSYDHILIFVLFTVEFDFEGILLPLLFYLVYKNPSTFLLLFIIQFWVFGKYPLFCMVEPKMTDENIQD